MWWTEMNYFFWQKKKRKTDEKNDKWWKWWLMNRTTNHDTLGFRTWKNFHLEKQFHIWNWLDCVSSMAISLTDTKWSPYNTQCNQLIMISTFQQLSSQSVSHFEKIVNERMKKKTDKNLIHLSHLLNTTWRNRT